MPIPEPTHLVGVEKVCLRCRSTDTKWRYYNNRSKVGEAQPRYHCNTCDRQFTYAGTARPTMNPQRPSARRTAEATANEVAAEQAAMEAAAIEAAATEAAAVEVARRIAEKVEKAARKVEKADRRAARRIAKRAAKRSPKLAEEPPVGSTSEMLRHPTSPATSEAPCTALVSASAGSDEDVELIVSMLSQYDDIDSGLEWMSDPCRDESEPDDRGLEGFQMWMDCRSADSVEELHWTDLVVIGMEMEGPILSPGRVLID